MASTQEGPSRIGKLVKDLALALLNATLLLIIVACICVLLVVNSVNNLGKELARSAVDAAVETVGEKPKETIARLTELSQSLKDINKVLSVDKKQDQETTQTDSSYSSGASTNGTDEKLSKLTVQIEEVNAKIETLLDKKEWLTDQFLQKTGMQVSDTLIRVRDCKPSTSLQ